MTEAKKPMAEANRISAMLNTVLGADRFPVKVDELALEYSRQCFADSPIDKIRGEDLDGFDGLLAANKTRSKWLILYNSATPSEGRKRFTIAHEFGHYILHRHQQDRFECGDDDIETGDNDERDIEAEADLFASTLLMPLDDFRRQVDGQPVNFDLLGHCADRPLRRLVDCGSSALDRDRAQASGADRQPRRPHAVGQVEQGGPQVRRLFRGPQEHHRTTARCSGAQLQRL